MEVAEHCVAPPPPDDPDRVRVGSFREERHRPSRSEGPHANFLSREANGRAGRADHDTDGFRDLGAAYRDPLVLVSYLRERSCVGGAVVLKVCDESKQHCHRTALGMACVAVAIGFSFDTITLCGEEEADKIRLGVDGWACRGQVCVERLVSDEERKVS